MSHGAVAARDRRHRHVHGRDDHRSAHEIFERLVDQIQYVFNVAGFTRNGGLRLDGIIQVISLGGLVARHGCRGGRRGRVGPVWRLGDTRVYENEYGRRYDAKKECRWMSCDRFSRMRTRPDDPIATHGFTHILPKKRNLSKGFRTAVLTQPATWLSLMELAPLPSSFLRIGEIRYFLDNTNVSIAQNNGNIRAVLKWVEFGPPNCGRPHRWRRRAWKRESMCGPRMRGFPPPSGWPGTLPRLPRSFSMVFLSKSDSCRRGNVDGQ